ncbi:MAG: hypothetical protein SRB1_01338 [Desulfobacteraceae bacterium Eth-SRB1]|nr:MAG: hypothetical protein SRB1_01338 [Desulfobacteraceae bacterium Eth-SRB1]
MIVDKQQELGWGKSVVEQLSKDIQEEYPAIQGFSGRNLWNMRFFYSEIQQNKKLQPLVAEISWTKNILILTKCKDPLEREFYMLHVRKFGWTKDVLIHQIENKTYEKYLMNQTNFDQTLPEKYKHQAKLAVKDHYTFDFLELAEEHSEHELEQTLVKNIRKFLIEMGAWFTFVSNQFRLKVGEKEYFIDLLLFHRKLKRFIAVELKIGEFKPEYKGKMEFYLTALNEQYKVDDENDAIGIIVCKSKDKTVVEYSLKTTTQPIGVATYNTSPYLPDEYSKYLPAPEVIAERLAIVKDLFEDEG